MKHISRRRSILTSVHYASAALSGFVLVSGLGCTSDPPASNGNLVTMGFTGGQIGGGTGGLGSGGILATGGSGSGGLLVTATGGIATGGVSGTGGLGTGGDTGTGGVSGTGGLGTGGDSGATCPLPATFHWTSTGALAEPMNPNAKSLKDFSVTKYNGKYLVYATTADGNWNGFMSTFTTFDEWATAEQKYIPGLVAPTIFYFTPKDVWVLTYQWGFKYATSTTPDDPTSWSQTQPLISGDDATQNRGVGPIDQTVICDDTDCYIFYADDAGGIYRGSMPIDQFPGTFSGMTRILDDASIIFEGVQVYSIKGSTKYLMIIENNGTRAFRAWTADSLGGDWTQLAGASTTQEPFAGEANVTWPDGQWTKDISHGDLVREDPSEKMMVDPCHLQLLYQGRDPNANVGYIDLPYRPGLLTLDN